MSKRTVSKNELKPIQHVAFSILFLLIGIALLIAFVHYTKLIVREGLSNKFYYVILIPMGLSASGFVFGVLKATAAYKGEVYNGKLQLGGPIVLFVMVVGGGFVAVPPDARIDFPYMISLQDRSGRLLKDGMSKLTISLGTHTQPPLKVDDGSVYVKAIPIQYLEKQVDVLLESPNWIFENGTAKTKITLDSTSKVLTVKLKESCTTIIVRPPLSAPEGRVTLIGLAGSPEMTKPDETGVFFIRIPEQLQNESKQTLKVIEQNGKHYEMDVFPCQKNDIVLPS